MILSAKIPRWWNVTPDEVHWVGLHFRYGREVFAAAALDSDLRKQVIDALWLYAAPARTSAVARLLEQGDVKAAVDRVTPAEMFSVARELAAKRPVESSTLLPEINRLHEQGLTYDAISRAFGTPKPTLAN